MAHYDISTSVGQTRPSQMEVMGDGTVITHNTYYLVQNLPVYSQDTCLYVYNSVAHRMCAIHVCLANNIKRLFRTKLDFAILLDILIT